MLGEQEDKSDKKGLKEKPKGEPSDQGVAISRPDERATVSQHEGEDRISQPDEQATTSQRHEQATISQRDEREKLTKDDAVERSRPTRVSFAEDAQHDAEEPELEKESQSASSKAEKKEKRRSSEIRTTPPRERMLIKLNIHISLE